MTRSDSSARRLSRVVSLLVLIAGFLSVAEPASAYIGPGAGFALLSSFLVLFTTIILAAFSLLILPFRFLFRLILRKSRPKPWIERLIVVGFDGQDPKITERLMKEGKLPNFKRLADKGSYSPLRTTYPSISPVAWSSFSTGTNPARHNIFDFLDRDRRTYLPVLSSTHIGGLEKFLKIGRYRVPLRKPEVRLLRKSKPFWSILGEHNIWSSIIRVPITFPPDHFYGAQLSAMCVPDLLGTQGTFLYFTTRPSEAHFKEGGMRIPLAANGTNADRFETKIEGPENAFREDNAKLALPLTIELDRVAGHARVTIQDTTVELKPGRLSDWVTLTFKAAPGIKVSGICRMEVLEMAEHFSLYMTPINIDPEKPAMPISHPSYYSTYLAKKIGPYTTLGLAEDTWALNEGVTSDGTFLQQAYDIDRERQDMFFAALNRLRRGSLVCVFDATDRIQHMFWHYIEEGHPANRNGKADLVGKYGKSIEEIYIHNDKLVGKVLDGLKDGDLLFVISDHGFNSFRRGVNLNSWLHANGYLALKDGKDGSTEWLRDVDWSRTKAYCLGLTGMFLNMKGREAEGIVVPGEEATRVKEEIISKLNGLMDEEKREVGIKEVFDTAKVYGGPYVENAPDLIIGYNGGYRISWDGATGMVSGPVFQDNVKSWSGDHCIDPRLVPGILFCSRKIDSKDPALIDIAPSALRLFGLDPPDHMDGKPLFSAETFRGQQPQAAS
jgi:predicted AlkP superfamily phosphohydrolase/phosphomutase